MRFFKQLKENVTKDDINNMDNIMSISFESDRENLIVDYLIDIILEIGDEEDVEVFQEKLAQKFSHHLKEYVKDFEGKESLKTFFLFLNLFLSKENLGEINNIQIDIHNKKFKIILKDSSFAKALNNNKKLIRCRFYEVLFSNIFSLLLLSDIEFKEIKCSSEGDNNENICVFENI